MKFIHKITTFAVAAGLVCASVAQASQIRIESPTASSGFDGFAPDGTTELATFGASQYFFAPVTFAPTWNSSTTPLGDWFSLAEIQWSGDASTTWGVSGPTGGRFAATNIMEDASVNGQTGYIMGWNAAKTEIFVAANNGWVFPTYNALDLTADGNDIWNVTNSGTTALAGALDGSSLTFASTEVIPEPSTYLLMALGMGLVFFTTRRKR